MSITADLPKPSAVAAEPARPVRVRSREDRSRGLSALYHGLLAVASLIALFPVVWIAFIALGPDKSDFLHPGAILGKASLSNFAFVLQHTDFLSWFANSAIVALGTTVVGVMVAASTGYAVSRMRFPGYRKLMFTLLLTQAFPIAIVIVPMYTILASLNLLDSYAGLILTYSGTTVPYCAWLLKGYFDTIPMEIDEAGRVDGLTPFGTFWRLILPLARPGLAVAGFYSFLTAWAEVPFATTFMLSSDKYTLAVGLQTYVSEHDAQWHLMAATAVLIAIPAALAFYLVQKNLVTGLTAGAAKS